MIIKRMLFWIPPALVMLGSSLAAVVAMASILQRDNEHGIATFFGLLMYVPGLLAYLVWIVFAGRGRRAAAYPLITRWVPAAFLFIGALLIFITLFSPYGFLYD